MPTLGGTGAAPHATGAPPATPEPFLTRVARAVPGLALALAAAALVVAAGSFAWGTARTLHGGVLPRLAALLALVIAARVLRRPRPAALFADPDRGALWRERLGALADAGLVTVAVWAALDQAWVLVRRLTTP